MLGVLFYNALYFRRVEENAFTKFLGTFAIPDRAEIENLRAEYWSVALF